MLRLLLLVLPWALAPAAPALMIDEFDGLQVLQIQPGTRFASSSQAGTMLSGSRRIVLQDLSSSSFGSAVVDQSRFAYATSGTTSGVDSTFAFYDVDPALAPVDLTDGGQATGFLLSVTGVTGQAAAWVNVTDDDGVNTRWFFTLQGFLTGPGAYYVDFSDWSRAATGALGDLTRVRAVNLRLSTFLAGEVTVTRLETVPEASLAGLLGAALIAATSAGCGRTRGSRGR